MLFLDVWHLYLYACLLYLLLIKPQMQKLRMIIFQGYVSKQGVRTDTLTL